MRWTPAFMALTAALSGCVTIADEYREYAEITIASGGLRTETAPSDAPINQGVLEANFERIAFFTEYTTSDGELREEQTATTLSRWETKGPITLTLQGDGVRDADYSSYQALTRRLSALTGVPMEVRYNQRADIVVHILNEDARDRFVKDLADSDFAGGLDFIADWSEQLLYPCVALVGYGQGKPGRIVSGIIAIKAELEGVMRESCIHEELAQVMGLLNDHPDARPSIFNDDEEFALLTVHDELLLRVLYDTRLRPNMSLKEARPIIPEIIRGVLANGG